MHKMNPLAEWFAKRKRKPVKLTEIAPILRIDWSERHAEHADSNMAQDFKTRELTLGDTFHGELNVGIGTNFIKFEANADIEILYVAPGHLKVTFNHFDYLAELERKRNAADAAAF